MADSKRAAELVVQSLVNAGVKYVFGIPGAKIDAVFDELENHPEIKLIVCRHEQNAGFIAQGLGRITSRPGVCAATSGPGGTNLTTALATANTEGDPVLALVGSVPRVMSLTSTHQSLSLMDVFKPVVKHVANVVHEDEVAEAMLNAWRTAGGYRKGVAAIDLPLDIMSSTSAKLGAFPSSAWAPYELGPASLPRIQKVAQLIQQSKRPIIFLGTRAAEISVVSAIHSLLKKYAIPVVETFQAAGAMSRELVHLFCGRLGLFRNQPGDKLLATSDLILTIGFDVYEYDAQSWNPDGDLRIVSIDTKPCDFSHSYAPIEELLGNIAETAALLEESLPNSTSWTESETFLNARKEFVAWTTTDHSTHTKDASLTHPLTFIHTLQSLVDDDTYVMCDVGSVYIWMSRYFYSYQPRHFLVSNGQQTLGVALPWAIAACLHQRTQGIRKKVVSISGDGGFMFTSMDLSTAVQQGCDITHFVWNDAAYNMVEFQEEAKYGRSSGIELGGVDFAKFAEAFGARGLKINSRQELDSTMKKALSGEFEGVTIVDVPIDYSENAKLMQGAIKGKVG